MSRITPPTGYDSWNQYILDQQEANPDQSIEALRLLKRDIKLGDISEIERQAGGDTESPSYRLYNTYVSPGKYAPFTGRPFLPQLNNGLYRYVYNGYFGDDVAWFDDKTEVSSGVNTTPVTYSQSGISGDAFSNQLLGYFFATTTQTYTFYTTSDDASYVWVGDTALTGYTTSNAIVNNGGLHGSQERSGTINLTQGHYYYIRIQYGDAGLGESLSLSISTPTISKTTNLGSHIFYNPQTNGF